MVNGGATAFPWRLHATHVFAEGLRMIRRPLTAAARPLKALFVGDAFAGVLLIATAVAALIAANSPLAGDYFGVFHAPLAWTPLATMDTLHAWINDGLMAVFFFVVGLEVKREMVVGELADARQRRLPVLAAVAGMALPAAIYLAVAGGEPALHRGWAIPAATDIAFAMGVVGLLGKRVPPALRLFLLTVAVVDDIGAVAIIAMAYTAALAPGWLLAALVVFAGLVGLNRTKVQCPWPYLVGAAALWFCVLHSGVHATVAGVVAALTVPLGLLERFEHRLVGWNAYFVVPLFGFANAGVSLADHGWSAVLTPLPLAIGAGLVFGKQLGIFTAIAVADRTGFAARPTAANWAQIWGVSVLAGIGFTMSLFIAALAFPLAPALVEEAKIGILGGSLISALLGYAVLRLASR
jgi:NhaA family Na+:H+ antiporter